ncbi:hypothetical protein Ddye_030142 [Dipteronia dyeriana]|uniref:RNase H type-1 domain-containing protein n=1 Tax=Dipteronia dyeriana TaxID=168575 RepID=A0AAD9TH20_9ROSI|nr:hypothetical protein Ddye_030142 [Dipteronia dyeriana]
MIVGSRDLANLWSDIFVEGRPLKESFPRCFALDVKKTGVVQDFEQDVSQVADLVKYRIVWWFKHLGKGSNETMDSLLINLKDLCVDNKNVKMPKLVDWIPPTVDNLKFNVDGSSKGKPGPSGIGGVLRDSYGKVLCLFSAFSGILDSNVADLWAIKRAVELCFSNLLLRGRDILVVRVSKVAVAWVNKDSLAKMGSSKMGDFVKWSDVGLVLVGRRVLCFVSLTVVLGVLFGGCLFLWVLCFVFLGCVWIKNVTTLLIMVSKDSSIRPIGDPLKKLDALVFA